MLAAGATPERAEAFVTKSFAIPGHETRFSDSPFVEQIGHMCAELSRVVCETFLLGVPTGVNYDMRWSPRGGSCDLLSGECESP